jgi:Phasin protein
MLSKHPTLYDRSPSVPLAKRDRSALEVVFSDMRAERSTEEPSSCTWSFAQWQQHSTNAAIDSIYLLNFTAIDIWQRNSNAGFALLRKLTEVKSPGSAVELQSVHVGNQIAALAAQRDEVTALVLKIAMTFLSETWLAGWRAR